MLKHQPEVLLTRLCTCCPTYCCCVVLPSGWCQRSSQRHAAWQAIRMFIIRSNHFWVNARITQIASGECVSSVSPGCAQPIHATVAWGISVRTMCSIRGHRGAVPQCALLPHTSDVLEGSFDAGQGHGSQRHPGEAITICRTFASAHSSMCHQPPLSRRPCPECVLHAADRARNWSVPAVLVYYRGLAIKVHCTILHVRPVSVTFGVSAAQSAY